MCLVFLVIPLGTPETLQPAHQCLHGVHVCFLYVDVFSSLLLIIHYHSIDKAYSLVVIVLHTHTHP